MVVLVWFVQYVHAVYGWHRVRLPNVVFGFCKFQDWILYDMAARTHACTLKKCGRASFGWTVNPISPDVICS